MKVHEIMTPGPMSVGDDTTIARAWEVLCGLDVRHLPVVNRQRELVGILSDRDFAQTPAPAPVADIVGQPRRALEQSVSTIMTGRPYSVDEDAEVSEVIELMVEHRIGAVPVTNPDGQVSGIVSYLDVLDRMGEDLGT